MPTRTKRSAQVPRDVKNPIQHLLDQGATLVDLAAAWKFRHTDAVYRLKRFEYPPTIKTAKLMAKTFGWTPGEVIDFWVERVAS